MQFLSRKETLGCTAGSAALLGLSLATGVALPAALPAMIAQISLAAFISASAVFFSYGFATRVVWPGLHMGWDRINNFKWFKKKDTDNNNTKVVELVDNSTPAPEVVKTPSLLQRGIQLAKDLGQTISVKAQNAYASAKEKGNQAIDSVKVKWNQASDFAKAQWTKLKTATTQTWQEIKNVGFVQWAKSTAKFNFSFKPALLSKKKPIVVEEVALTAPVDAAPTSAGLESNAPQAATEVKETPVVDAAPAPSILVAASLATPANDAPKAEAQETPVSAPLTASFPLAVASETPAPLAAVAQEIPAPLAAAAQETPAPAAATPAPQAAQETSASALMTPPRAAERAIEPPAVAAKPKGRRTNKSRVSAVREEGDASDFSASDREDNVSRRTRARSPMPSSSAQPPVSPGPDVLSAILDQPVPATYAPLARASSDASTALAAAPSQHQERAPGRRLHSNNRK